MGSVNRMFLRCTCVAASCVDGAAPAAGAAAIACWRALTTRSGDTAGLPLTQGQVNRMAVELGRFGSVLQTASAWSSSASSRVRSPGRTSVSTHFFFFFLCGFLTTMVSVASSVAMADWRRWRRAAASSPSSETKT